LNLRQHIFENLSQKLIELHQGTEKNKQRFLSLLSAYFPTLNINQKISDFYKYDLKTLLSEFAKQKIEVSMKKIIQLELEDFFKETKYQIEQEKLLITQLENELDQLVYALYELNQDEIAIIEKSLY
jgi:hypothetical protein